MNTQSVSSKQFFLILLSLIIFLSTSDVSADVESKRVLILNSYHEGYHWTDRIMAGIHSVFDEQSDIELHIDYMDTKRIVDKTHFENLRSLYKHKYNSMNLNAIIVTDDHALNFLLQYRDELFPGIPVFFIGINDYEASRMINQKNITGITVTYDVFGTIELMLDLHPNAKEIVVISDGIITGGGFRKLIERAAPNFSNSVRFRYLTNLNTDELRETLADLDDDALVLWAIYLRTREGLYISVEQSIKLATSSNLPAYCLFDVVGFGVIGGKILNPNNHGKSIAEMTLGIIRGGNIDEMPIIHDPPLTYKFDYRVMQRFGITEKSVPPGSIIMYKSFSIYEKYKLRIWAAIILILILIVVVIVLSYYIRKQKQAEYALQDKEKEQREMLNFMVSAVISIDDKGTIFSFNKMAETIFGYSFEEALGQNINLLIPDLCLQYSLKTSDAQLIGVGWKIDGLRKNKQTFPMRFSVAELPADKTGKCRFISTCQDLTQINQQEEHLRRAQKMDALGKLIGGISHDFNNLLGVILGYADLLKNTPAEQAKQAEYVDKIYHAGERGTKLTDKLLSFSRKKTTEAVKLDINALLQEEQDMLQKILTVRIKLLIDLADDVWPIWLNKSDLEDTVLNMTINAMHAMQNKESGAQLSIRTCNHALNALDAQTLDLKAGDYVELSLTDTGCGMDETTKEKIFDPFFSTKGDKGTGLGLYQVFSLVKQTSGTIRVHSQLGHGSKFVIYFPRYFGSDSENITDTSVDNIELMGNEKLLIVDDEVELRDLASDLLSRQGYRVFCAENGKQALQILEHEHIDLMLADVIMPEMDGYQLAAIVKEKYPTIKIQMSSGLNSGLYVNTVDESLKQNLLTKPYNSQSLLKNIRSLLNNKITLHRKRPNI